MNKCERYDDDEEYRNRVHGYWFLDALMRLNVIDRADNMMMRSMFMWRNEDEQR